MSLKKKKVITGGNWLEKYKYFLVFGFACLVYINTIPNNYCMDDELVTTVETDQPHRLTHEGISAIPKIFTEPYYKDGQGYAYDYRPIVLVTFAIEHSLFGDNPHVSHFINVILYGFLCVVLLLTLCQLFNSYNVLLPIISTLIFTAHPIHTEVVGSIKNRDEILALLFGLLSLFFLIKTLTHSNKLGMLVCAILFFALSILSKSTSICFVALAPFVIILFYRTIRISLFVYIFIGSLLFSLVTPTIQVFSVFTLAIAVSLFILFVYVLTGNINLSSWLNALTNKLNTYTLSRVKADNNKSEEDDYLPFTLTNNDLAIGGIALFTVSVLLYFLGYTFYLLPIAVISLYPFFYKGTNKWLIPIVHCLAIIVVVEETKSAVLSTVYGLQLMYMYFVRNKNEYLYSLFVYLTVCGVMDKSWHQENGWMPQTGIFIMLFGSYKTKRFQALKYIPVIIVLVVYLVLSTSLKSFLSTTVLNLSIVNGFIIIAISVLPRIRKYLPLLISIQIIAVTTIANTQPRQGSIKLEIAQIVTAITPPSIIDKKTIDRPISVMESVTNQQSLWEHKLGTTAQVFRKYVQLLVVPYPMSFYYGYKVIDKQSVFKPINLVTLFFYIAIGIIGLIAIRKNKILAAGIFIYLISISIYANLLLPIPGMMADRFLFVPSIGFSLLLGYGLLWLFKINIHDAKVQLGLGQISTPLKYTLFSLLLVYSTITIARNTQWKDSITLFSSDIDHLQESAQANNLYALNLMKYSYKETNALKAQQMRETAEKHFKQALNIYPDFFNARYDLARSQSTLLKENEAEENFVIAAKMNPEYPTAWLSAAEIAMRNKRYTNAIQYFSSIQQKYRTGDPAIYLQWSYAYYLTQNYDSANYINKLGAQSFPQTPNFLLNIGQTFATINKKDSALYYYEKALQLTPNNVQLQEQIRQMKTNR